MVENQWRILYRAAILELEPQHLELRVKAAHDAIHERISSDRVSVGERKEMEDALSALHILKQR